MGSLVKGMIGKEDLNLASDDKYPSTFTRLASTGPRTHIIDGALLLTWAVLAMVMV